MTDAQRDYETVLKAADLFHMERWVKDVTKETRDRLVASIGMDADTCHSSYQDYCDGQQEDRL